MGKTKKCPPPRTRVESNGFTLIEIMIVVLIIAFLAAIAVPFFHAYIERAHNITVKHDLRNFVTAEMNYWADHTQYLGATGDFMEAGNAGSTLSFPECVLSMDVKIEITSGDGSNPEGPPPFRAEANHERASVTYIYDFTTKQMSEREK